MNIAVRYYTRSGNTKKLAEAVAAAVGANALDVTAPLNEKADILFLGSSYYAFDVDDAVKEFLKKLETKGLVSRMRSETDKRNLVVSITDDGEKLKEKAVEIPLQIAGCTNLTKDEAAELYTILYKILGKEGNNQ